MFQTLISMEMDCLAYQFSFRLVMELKKDYMIGSKLKVQLPIIQTTPIILIFSLMQTLIHYSVH